VDTMGCSRFPGTECGVRGARYIYRSMPSVMCFRNVCSPLCT
jgi:hypothetical protein